MERAMFDVHVEVALGVALLGSAYLLGVGPLRRRLDGPDAVARQRVLCFLGGLAVIFVALNGPLHELSDRHLFSAHMVQHLLLALVVPAMLLGGTPGWLLRAVLRHRGVARAARLLTRPLLAAAMFNAVLAAWHLPLLYDWAMREHGLHIVQHLMLVAAGLLLWWPVLSPLPELPRLPPPAQLLYLFLAGVPMVLVAALITLADDVLYPFYGQAPRQWGLTPLADQRLGGVIMWVPGTLVFLIAITVVFFRWVRAEAELEAAAASMSARAGRRHGNP